MIVFSLLMVFFRNTYLEFWGVTLAVFLLSISALFYIIVGQFFFSKLLKLVPISGFCRRRDLFVFLALPIVIGIVSRLGGEALFYRTMFLEEIGKDYVRTARSKGLSETVVLFRHVLRNALLPILTSTVAVLPLLFLGALIMESFFGIPGPRQLHDRRDQRAGLRDRALDGVRRLGALHRRPHPDRHLVHRRRSAHPAELGRADMPKLVFLATDIALYGLLVAIAFYVWHALRTPTLRQTWRSVLHDPVGDVRRASCCCVFLAARGARLGPFPAAAAAGARRGRRCGAGVLDAHAVACSTRCWPARARRARRPTRFRSARTSSRRSRCWSTASRSATIRGCSSAARISRTPTREWAADVARRSVAGLAGGAVGAAALWLVVAALRARSARSGVGASRCGRSGSGPPDVPWRSMLLTASVLALFAGWVAALWPYYHVFGTDQTGNDVLFQAIKSIRTAVVIGSLATLATLPFAIVFGILAGYYKGRVDDAIQYLYTVLSSIPSVLLIAAFVLMIQVFVDKNPQMFETGLERADIRLFLLAAILGITGWAGLARLLRAETLKLVRARLRAGGARVRRVERRHHAPPHPAQRDAHRADRRGARFLRPRALRGGALVRRRRRRPDAPTASAR